MESREFAQLNECFPRRQDAVVLKALAVNALYRTNIFPIEKVGRVLDKALTERLSTNDAPGPDLVEELVEEVKGLTGKRHYSFASKFTHFFINPDLPILDQYAEWVAGKHLGKERSQNQKRYLRFAEDVNRLKELAGLTCSCRLRHVPLDNRRILELETESESKNQRRP